MIAYNDLTEKKAKDVELMKQMESITRLQKQSEAMIRENPLAIAIFRADRSILDFNKEYENLWQASREELLQKGLTDFNVKTVKGEDYYASFETKNEAISELEVTLRDGTRRFLTLYQVPVLNSSGEIEVNYYFYVDLTPQRELERYQGTFIRTLVENMKRLGSGDFQLDLAVEPHGIYTRDAHDRFIEINKNLGLTRDAIGAMIQDTQAISDAVESMEVASAHADVISLNLCNVQKGTPLERLWERGEYRPPWLWSAVLAMMEHGSRSGPPLICDPVGAGTRRGPHNCGKCDSEIAGAIRRHALEQDLSVFEGLDCGCRAAWQKVLELEELELRVAAYLIPQSGYLIISIP